jgi:hypothetical protein
MSKTVHPRHRKPTRWGLMRTEDGWMVSASLCTFVPPSVVGQRTGSWRTRREALACGRLLGLGIVRAVKL